MTNEEKRALGRVEGKLEALTATVGRLSDTLESMRALWWKIALAAAAVGGGGGFAGSHFGG